MRFTILVLLLASALTAQSSGDHNTLTPAEKAQGWVLLFDGKTFQNWQDPSTRTPKGDAWTIEDGCIKANAHPRITEDLVSAQNYRDFELEWDWRISEGGNSGVKYRIQDLVPLAKANRPPNGKKFEDMVDYALNGHGIERSQIGPEDRAQIYVIGFEYQMIDNQRHPDARRGPLYQSGALYSMIPPAEDATKPVGEFNHSRLVVRGNHIEHWLNGKKVVDGSLDSDMVKEDAAHRWGKGSPVYRLIVEQPKKDVPISLQNHGNVVWFRDIKIRALR